MSYMIQCFKSSDERPFPSFVSKVALCVGGTIIAVKIGRDAYARYQLKQARKSKQEACKRSKTNVKNKLRRVQDNEKWEEIRRLPAAELIDKLQKNKLKAVDVVRAYQSYALEVDEELNCVCEPIVEAERWANELDQGPVTGSLHGLPISIKDSYGIQGYDQTLGSSIHIGHPYAEDAVIIKVLKHQGAIPMVKTNSPQTMFSFDCSNPIYGATKNPHNKKLSPGGSSGGESALLASSASILGFGSDLGGSVRIPSNMCGTYALKPTIGRVSSDCSNPILGATKNPHNKNLSPGGSSGGESALLASSASILGFGSDLGGSVRIPSNMCGTYALKPTIGRVSKKGMHGMCRANQMVASSLGPMARDTDTLVAAMRALLIPYMYKLDPNLSPILFQEDIFNDKRPLRIGYYTYDGFIHAVPAQVRGVNMAKAALEEAGHTLVPWVPPNAATAYSDVWLPLLVGDEGAAGFMKELKHDAVDPCIYPLYHVLGIKQKTRKLMSRLFWPFSQAKSDLYSLGTDYKTVGDWWSACRLIETFREDCATSWVEHELDAVIFPGFACPALEPGNAILPMVSYTAMYNTLNWPAGTLPVTKVNQADLDKLAKEYPTEPYYHGFTKEASKCSINMPINVQVAALPFKDEMCLRVMKELENALKN